MDIIYEGAIDKALEGTGKNVCGGKPGRQFMKSSMINTSNNQMLIFQKSSLLKWKQEFNFSHFLPVRVEKYIQQIGLEYRLFSQIVKIKLKNVGETYTASKKKKKTK